MNHIFINGAAALLVILATIGIGMLVGSFLEWLQPETFLERAAAPFVFLYAFGWVVCTVLWRAYLAIKARYANRRAIRRYYAPTKGTLDEFYGDFRP
jgi:hypothetical protein